jgi:hypothetical protein
MLCSRHMQVGGVVPLASHRHDRDTTGTRQGHDRDTIHRHDRDTTGTRQGHDKDTTGTRQGHDSPTRQGHDRDTTGTRDTDTIMIGVAKGTIVVITVIVVMVITIRA